MQECGGRRAASPGLLRTVTHAGHPTCSHLSLTKLAKCMNHVDISASETSRLRDQKTCAWNGSEINTGAGATGGEGGSTGQCRLTSSLATRPASNLVVHFN